ncbi:unnamed protein product, partial [Coccothraustes coccothraustes]
MGYIPQPNQKVNPDDPWGRALPFVAALGTLPHLRSSPLPSNPCPAASASRQPPASKTQEIPPKMLVV